MHRKINSDSNNSNSNEEHIGEEGIPQVPPTHNIRDLQQTPSYNEQFRAASNSTKIPSSYPSASNSFPGRTPEIFKDEHHRNIEFPSLSRQVSQPSATALQIGKSHSIHAPSIYSTQSSYRNPQIVFPAMRTREQTAEYKTMPFGFPSQNYGAYQETAPSTPALAFRSNSNPAEVRQQQPYPPRLTPPQFLQPPPTVSQEYFHPLQAPGFYSPPQHLSPYQPLPQSQFFYHQQHAYPHQAPLFSPMPQTDPPYQTGGPPLFMNQISHSSSRQSYAQSFETHHSNQTNDIPADEKVVRENNLKKPESSPTFFSTKSSSSEDEPNETIGSNIYSPRRRRKHLNLFMKDLSVRTQKSSDAVFSRFCYLLEIDCCSVKSDGTEPYICDPLHSVLLTNFINNTAPWLDIFCSVPLFFKFLPQISLCEEGSMIHNCILSCGALYLHRDKPKQFDAKFALKYYNSALKLLSMKILQNDRVLPRCLISSILLNHYEDFAGEIQNKFNHHAGSRIILQEILTMDTDKRRNFKHGSATGRNLSKLNSLEHNEFLEACFWVITNNDLQESLKWEIASRWSLQNPNTTVLSMSSDPNYDEKISEYISNFFDIDFKRVGDEFFAEKNELWWLRKSAYNLQLVNDYRHQPYVISQREHEDNLMIQKWIELKKMIDIYGKYIPASVRKIVYKPGGETGNSRFPQILFKNAEAVIIYMNYHLSCLLIYDALLNRSGLFSTNSNEAKRAAQILSDVDREFLLNKKKIKQMIKQHSVTIIGILNSYHGNIVIWSLTLGHFKVALRVLRKYDEFHKELDPLVLDIQEYTRTRFNRV